MDRHARLRSLDAFRGLTIAGMILVNNPGSWEHIYPPLEHAEWNGWTPTDLIFPFFLFIVGVSLTFSFARRVELGAGRAALVRKVVLRSAAIFAVGLALNFIPRFDPATVRIPGVLQRIAVAYLVAALVYVLAEGRTQWWIAGGLLVGYWLLMTFVPVPGYGAGVLAPVGNLAQYVDIHLMRGHTWKPEWDPEGLLSTLPAIATCLLGAFAGGLLRSDRAPVEKAVRLFLWGTAAIAAGVVWSVVFPINKNLWTSSYALFTAGMALHVLGVLYWIIDVRGWRGWAWPLYVFGSNALLVFVLSGLAARLLGLWKIGGDPDAPSGWHYAYLHWFAAWAGPLNGSLLMALSFVAVWLAVMAVFHRRGWLLRV